MPIKGVRRYWQSLMRLHEREPKERLSHDGVRGEGGAEDAFTPRVGDPIVRREIISVFPFVRQEGCVGFNEELIWPNAEKRTSSGKMGTLSRTLARPLGSSINASPRGKLLKPLFLSDVCFLVWWVELPTGSDGFGSLVNYVNTKQNHDHCIFFFPYGFSLYPR